MPAQQAQDRPGGVRTPAPVVVVCQACRTPLSAPRPGQKACSPKCRAKLHRHAQAVRERELRRLLAASRALIEAAERVFSLAGELPNR
jgi:LSD1 subclass zinc finger protein